ncbi:MAG TPA: SLC13 family permease [Flavobacteriaceae bacterium]|nr:SLC13 family permease [Flavobacteriaceae bacterium]
MFELPELAQHIIVITVTIALMGLLLVEKFKPAYIFFGAVLVFLISGIIDTNDFLLSLANESILSIFLLIFITFGIRTNFNILKWMDKIFGSAKTGRGFIARMTPTVSVFSSFLNNTPIVALFLPYVYEWARKKDVAPSKLLIPLSYAAMSGGMITVIGTSTNLILSGLAESEGATPPGFLDYFFPGILVSLGTVIFLSTIGYAILPGKEKLFKMIQKKSREYMVEVNLTEDAKIIGKTIKQADLADLNGIDLFEIVRYGVRISPVPPDEIIRQKDNLVFVGNSEKIIELLKRRDDFSIPKFTGEDGKEKIKNFQDSLEEEDKEDDERELIETLIPTNSALIGHTLKESNFREHYGAAVIGIHRNGVELKRGIDKIKLQPGDLLLIVPGKDFRKQSYQEDDLYVVSIKKIGKVSKTARRGFIGVLLGVIAGLAFEKINLFFALLILISYMVASKMVSITNLKKQFSVNLFVVLVASLAFSAALINSGVAEIAATGFLTLFEPMGNQGILIGIYLVTLILASFVTHAAAVAIVFPMAYSIASQASGLDMTAVFIAIAFAASASFHTPFSYQTNMMVYGPGEYKFTDFLKVGAPLTLIYSVIALAFMMFYYQV